MIVEDNIYDAYALITILEQLQLDYTLVTNGREALTEVQSRWERNKTMYKLIVMD